MYMAWVVRTRIPSPHNRHTDEGLRGIIISLDKNFINDGNEMTDLWKC